MTNLQSSDGGCFYINGALIALDAATFTFNDDDISISVGYPDPAPNFQKYDQITGDGAAFASIEAAKTWIADNCFKKKEGDVDPGAATWGDITGTLSDQSDLSIALDDKPSRTEVGVVVDQVNTNTDAIATKANSAITITGTGALAGGGTLAANRTITASSATIASLAKADTALQPATLTNSTILGKNSAGTIASIPFTSDPTASTIVYRDANSNFKSGTAIAATDVINLQGLNAATKAKAAIVALTALDPAADLPTAVTAINQIISALKS